VGIKDKATYGEYYWAMQVEAQKLIAEDTEKEMSTMAARLMGSLHLREYLPDEFASLFAELEAPAGAFLGDVGGRFVSEVADGAVSKAASPFFEAMGYAAYNFSPTKKLTPAATATLYSRKKITEDFFFERFRMGGFEPIEAKFQFDSMRPYPSIPDLVLYSRYHGDPANVWTTLLKYMDVDAVDYPVWEWLALQRLTTLQSQTLYKRGLFERTEFSDQLARIGWSPADVPRIEELAWLMPNAMLLVQGGLLQGTSTDKLLADISIAEIHPKYAQTYLDAVLTKPATTDIIAYELRRDPGLSGLPSELRKIGVHPAYSDVFRELAYIIPPTGDLITMAVREAFTPEIAARFGQYQDFPPEFEFWAAKKGLTKEWAERYWAAHWSLPSPQQGFEMLHRGVIGQDELNMLLRALDVMPFWRDKLTKIAYRRLTRVDIRRMYRVGVLDETQVYEANLELGYNERDSQRMTEFTVKQTLQTLSKFTSRDVINAYVKRMIDRSEASSLLVQLGVKSGDISFIISTADYKRAWELTESRIAGIRNLYRKRVYDINKTRDELSRLDLPAEQIEVLMKQWYYEIAAEVPRHWTTAQTLSFAKEGLISKERATAELKSIGYNAEHIAIYMKAAG